MEFKTEPFSHQLRVFNQSKDLDAYAVLWEQGTGKTKLGIDTCAYQYLEGQIDALLVVAPNGVHLNWETDELPAHLLDKVRREARVHAYRTDKKHTKAHKQACEDLLKHKGLAILTMSYDAFMTEEGKLFAWKFLTKRKVLYVLDESHRIKNAGAKRTKSIVASGKYAKKRRIMTGTPIATGPFDIYPQVKFLDEEFWRREGFDSYAAFKAHFGIFKPMTNPYTGRTFDQLVAFRNLDQLNKILEKISSRVTKDEVLDLPEKLYSRRYFELSKEQRSAYQQLQEEQLAFLETGDVVLAPLAITMMLRLQQITSGYLPVETEDGEDQKFVEFKTNPRIELMEELRDDIPHKTIVWAKFTRDIDKLVDLLGPNAKRYDGKADDDARQRAKVEFQKGDLQWLVANPAALGEGHTLHASHTNIFYNNSHKLIHRLQAEDRTHRSGQKENVLYIDLEAANTVDGKIISSLVGKFDIASQITGDKYKEWLRT